MPFVYKSRPVELLDEFFSGEGDLTDAYRFSTEILATPGDLAATTTTLADAPPGPPGFVSQDATDFRNVWLQPLADQNVEVVMRRAYEKAIELATEDPANPKPLETFWVTAAGSEFEMHVCSTDKRVTVFVFTPIERQEPGSRRAASRSFAVRTRDGQVEVEQVSGADTAGD